MGTSVSWLVGLPSHHSGGSASPVSGRFGSPYTLHKCLLSPVWFICLPTPSASWGPCSRDEIRNEITR